MDKKKTNLGKSFKATGKSGKSFKAAEKNGKTAAHKPSANVITEWLYMNSKEISVTDIKNVLCEEYEVDVWREAGILEIAVGDASVDFEMSDRLSFKDELADTYVKENDVSVIYFISFKADIAEEAMRIMKKIKTSLNGDFLADTEDLMPRI